MVFKMGIADCNVSILNMEYWRRLALTEYGVDIDAIGGKVGEEDVEVQRFVQRQWQFGQLEKSHCCENNAQWQNSHLRPRTQPEQIRSKFIIILYWKKEKSIAL